MECSLVLLAVLALQVMVAVAVNEAYDVNCASGTTGRAVCTKNALDEVPAVLSYTECQALGMNDAGGSLGGNNCGSTLWWWPTWPFNADGYCATAHAATVGSAALADAQCAGYTPTTSLINLRNNAERCLPTWWMGKYGDSETYWTAVNDVANEGIYVDGEGNPVASEYLNWAAGEPTGAGENCVVFINNEAYDVNCASGTTGRAVCTKDAQAA